MRRDWRDTARTAADLAVLGFAVAVAALPVLTAGAAVATASEAVRHFLAYDSWPPSATLWATFRGRLARGLWAGPAVLGGLGLIMLDVAAVRRGLVPGGAVALTAVLLVAVVAAGWTALVAVLAGRPRAAVALAVAHPSLLAAAGGVVLLAGLLALLVHPVLVPVLVGFALFALHVVTARLAPVVD